MAEEATKPLREYIVARQSKTLAKAYNFCLDGICDFRQLHLEYAVSYIQSKVADESGTGGTPFMKWLAQLRNETQATKVAI